MLWIPHPRKLRKKASGTWASVLLPAALLAGCLGQPTDPVPTPSGDFDTTVIGEEQATLTLAPLVPPRITRTHCTKVIARLEVQETTRQIADGVDYRVWTFGGEVPGRFIRVRQGDLVEFHLSGHAGNTLFHNIDLHAVTGPGGGAGTSSVHKQDSATFTFRAMNPGIYVYHCATAPVGVHIASGMYGLILVQPLEGMAPVDKEFYVMQGEYYTVGKYGEKGLQEFSLEKAIAENPDYVVFNGAVGSLTGAKALKASVGQTVRLFVGNGGPNLVSSFHVIGEIFDRVYGEGSSTLTARNVQTTLIPSGGAAMLEFKVEVPGTYMLVDHSIFRTFYKGALGQLVVEGPSQPGIFNPSRSGDGHGGTDSNEVPKAVLMAKGEERFTQYCTMCHGGQGEGGFAPPLANSDFLMADRARSIRIQIQGLADSITVNGTAYNLTMPAMGGTDVDIAAVLTYVRSALNGATDSIGVKEVQVVRKGLVVFP